MRNDAKLKAAAVATSITLAFSGGIAIAEETTTTTPANAGPTAQVTDTEQNAQVTDAEQNAQVTDAEQNAQVVDPGQATQATDAEQMSTNATQNGDTDNDASKDVDTDVVLEAESTITTSDGRVLDLSNLDGYEPTDQELIDSLIAEHPGMEREDLEVRRYEGMWFIARKGTRVGWAYQFKNSTPNRVWSAAGGTGPEVGSGTTATPSDNPAIHVAEPIAYESGTATLTPATGTAYVSPTASVATPDANSEATTAAIPATSDSTSLVGVFVAIAAAVGAFIGAKVLRNRG